MAFDASQPSMPERDVGARAEAAFAAEIIPQIRALHDRRTALREQTRREVLIAGLAALGAAFLLAFVPIEGSVWMLAFIAGAVFIGWRLTALQKAWQSHVIETVMPVLCDALPDMTYKNDYIDSAIVNIFEDAGVIGKSNSQKLSHLISGRHRAIGFELLYADLYNRSSGRGGRGGSSSNVFHGLLFRIEVPITVPIQVLIKPRPYGIPASFGRLFEPSVIAQLAEVDLAPGEFTTKFEVRAALRDTDDADHVRTLISPGLQRAFLDLNEREGALLGNRAAFSAAFADNSFHLALARWTKTSIAGIGFERPRPFLDPGLYLLGDEAELGRRLRSVLDDVQIAYRLIDRLHATD